MSGFEWFLLVVVVILVPLVVAVAITLWTLEMARQRNRRNREAVNPGAGPVKRRATRDAAPDPTVTGAHGIASSSTGPVSGESGDARDDVITDVTVEEAGRGTLVEDDVMRISTPVPGDTAAAGVDGTDVAGGGGSDGGTDCRFPTKY